MKIDKSELKEMMAICVLANTPSYLYRRLRALPAIHRLAETVSEKKLVVEYRTIGSKRHRTIRDMAIAYGALVALFLRNPPPRPRTIESLKKVKLEWGPSLIERARSESTGVTEVHLHTQKRVTASTTKKRSRRSGAYDFTLDNAVSKQSGTIPCL